jgi:hypothetical protein
MLEPGKHCELLTQHIRDRNDHIVDGFKLFVQMFTALVGGSVAIRLQYGAKLPQSLALLGDTLAGLIFVATIVLIVDNVRARYGLRNKLSAVAGMDGRGNHIIPLPRPWWTARAEIVMVSVVSVAVIVFWTFNPLRATN